MIKYTKDIFINDIKSFKEKGYKEKILNIYKKLPKTECERCGVCCHDSPNVTYPELLLVLDYMYENLSKDDIVQIYKKAVHEFMYGFLSNSDKPCPFLKNNSCLVHERAPLSCKRWGLQSYKEYQTDLAADHSCNNDAKEAFAKFGVNISDEVINSITPYCNKVKVIKNIYNIVSSDFHKIINKDFSPMLRFYSDKNSNNFSLGTYMVLALLGNDVFYHRIKILKEYQDGNSKAIDTFIEQIDYTHVL